MKRSLVTSLGLIFGAFLMSTAISPAADQSQWGELHSRNMVAAETGLPVEFEPGKRDMQTGQMDLSTTKNVKWIARLGNMTYASPIVAGGKVFVGTNNDSPRDPRFVEDRGVLMCFDEKSGDFLWQLIVPKMYEYKFSDWHYCGICSPPSVENGRAYVVTNRCEVVCLDVEGMANGNDGPYKDEGRHMVAPGEDPVVPGPKDADIVWLLDMAAELGVRPHNASNCSVLVFGDLLYVSTSNGVEWTHSRVDNPEAPSLIVVNKNTGKLVARDDFGIGADIFHGQWSSPTLGQVGGKAHLYFGAGDGYLYAAHALDPAAIGDQPGKLKNVWRFNGHPLAQTQDEVPIDHQHDSTSYEVIANPVFYNNRVYVVFTQDPFHNMPRGWLTCLDATKTGDVTRSALVWSHEEMSSSCSTPAIADGLLYLVDFAGRLKCLDAETGEVYWVHAMGPMVWGSPLVADGKIYLGTARQTLWVLSAGKQLDVLARIRLRDRIFTTPTAANGVLYLATARQLYAVGK